MGVDCEVGLSDHSGDPLTAAVATALGARWIEVHLRDIDGSSPDDALHALEPAAFKQMVSNVRCAESMLGNGTKEVQKSEIASAQYRVRLSTSLRRGT
jgi:sialic acid synthase SpsE